MFIYKIRLSCLFKWVIGIPQKSNTFLGREERGITVKAVMTVFARAGQLPWQ